MNILHSASVGLPDEKLIRKASTCADQVIIYSYGGRPAEIWWSKLNVADYTNLAVINLADEETKQLAAMFSRGMKNELYDSRKRCLN